MGVTNIESAGSSGTRVWTRFGTAIGFLLLAGGIVAAYMDPASTYEISIYRETPAAFWVGVGVAVVVSATVTFSEDDPMTRATSLALGILAVLSTVLLPIIRNYHYFGHHDTLHHLGSAKDMWAGLINPFEFFYPGMHLLSLVFHALLTVPIRRALLLVVPVFVLLYVLVVPILAKRIFPGSGVFYVAAFSAVFLLPVNWLSIHVQPHSASMAVFFFAFPLWLFVMFYRTGKGKYAGILLVSLCMFVILHPQIMLAFCLFATAAYVTLYAVSTPGFSTEIVNWGSNTYTLIVSYLIFIVWTWNEAKLAGEIEQFLVVESSVAVNDVQQAQSSLSLIGVSIYEIFVKLFGVAGLYALFTGLLVLYVLFRAVKHLFTDSRRLDPINLQVLALASGLGALTALFVGYMVVSSNRGSQYRALGLIMLILTVLGSLAVRKGYDRFRAVDLGGLDTRRIARTALSVFLVLALVHSLLIVYPSPWIYRETMHVTETQMDGVEIVFEHGDEEMAFLSLKMSVFKYRKAVYGSETSTEGIGIPPQASYATENETARGATGIPYHFNDRNMTGAFEGRYLILTDVDTRTHTQMYRGVRYSEGDFRYLDTAEGIGKVVSNGGFRVYYLEPRNAAR